MTQGDERWDSMTDEEFIASYVEKHGYEAAVAIAKAMALPAPKATGARRQFAGNKPLPRKPLPRVKPMGVSWRETDNHLGWHDGYRGPRNRSGLPKSGAPRPPKRQAS